MIAGNGTIIAGFTAKKFGIVKHRTIKIFRRFSAFFLQIFRRLFGYNAATMDDFTPAQLITLCAVFIGIHVLAVPAFLWAMRHRQFSGREQKEWNINADRPQVPTAPLSAGSAPLPVRARVMLGVLSVFALAMIASVFFVIYASMQAAAHPAVGGPF